MLPGANDSNASAAIENLFFDNTAEPNAVLDTLLKPQDLDFVRSLMNLLRV